MCVEMNINRPLCSFPFAETSPTQPPAPRFFLFAETDDQAAEIEDAEEDADNDTDAAAGLGPRSLVSAGLAAAAGAAVVALAEWGL